MCPSRIQVALYQYGAFNEFTLFQPKLETKNAIDENEKVGATKESAANGEGKKTIDLDLHSENGIPEKPILTSKFLTAT